MNAFQKMAVVTVLATVLLISVGGLVRVTGAGLGCPDWPRCWGCWLPPSSVADIDLAYIQAKGFDIREFNPVKMWTEYINRMVGVVIGFLVIGTFARSIRYRKTQPRLFHLSWISVLVVGFEGWLGGQVVQSELHPILITIHMLFAIVLVSLLLYATFLAMPPTIPFRLTPGARQTVYPLSAALWAFTGIQMLIGTSVREGIDPFIKDSGGLPRSEWLAQVGTIDLVHRTTSWIVLITAIVLFWKLYNETQAGLLKPLSAVLLGGVVLQIGLGVILAYAGLPPFAQVLHLTVAAVLICVQFYTILVIRHQPTGV